MTTNPTASPVSALLERDRLQRFYPALVILTLLFGSAEATFGVLLPEPQLGAAGASTFLFAIGLIIAGRQLRRGRADRARIAVAISLTFFGALGTFLIAGLGLAMALLPLLSAILVLPYVVRSQLLALSVAAVSSSAGILAIGAAPHVFPEIGGDAGRVFEGAIFIGVVALVLAAVADFAIDSSESVLFLGALNNRRTHETAARLSIVASLRALEEQSTPEATAALIIGSMSGQPLIDVVLLLEDTDAGLVVLAAAGPEEHAIRVGEIVPSARARYLLARSARGAWAELWSERLVPGLNDELMSRLGIKGQAFAPIVVGDQMVGLIAIATTDAEEALHLLEDLPLVSELAALADKILAPALLARHNLRRERAAMATMIAAGGFSPVFQPVVDLATGVRVGFEALTRFASGAGPSDVFMDAARIGLGVELETATLAVAVRASAGLPDDAWLSLNVSAVLLGHSNALEPLLAHEVRPLILEVTEHEVIDDYEALHRALRRLGRDVRLATDDAGAGVANFRHLINLRAHMVKIDVAVVRGVDTDVSRQAVIAGLVHFAAVSGALILAEGIETKAEAETLKRLGVGLGQGYLLGRAAPVEHWRVRPAGRTSRKPIGRPRARPAATAEIVAAPAGG